ncbi:MAG: hypothetical protein KBB70_01970 [Candidatus Pacebacteria bacterium]|nr:hypothetical protein [Candidatus Paceibacterota bacterium]
MKILSRKKWFYIAALFLIPSLVNAALTCTVTTSCSDTALFNISATAGGHAELPNLSNYTNVVCCSGVTGLGNTCSGTYDTVLKLSDTKNAQVQKNTESGYAENACISVSSGSVSVGYQSGNCNGYDTTVASISGDTNAHVGNGSAYTTKVCASASAAALTFTISTNSIGFGTLTPANARYASADGLGSASEVEAHTIDAGTSATNGYSITVQGASLTNGGDTITAIGGVNTASSAGTEQFGLRVTATGGTGSVSDPYTGGGFAYAADATTTSEIGGAISGDGVTTTYSVRYITNVSTTTNPGSYTGNVTYVMTSNY